MLPRGSIRAERIWKRFRQDRKRFLLTDEVQRLKARLMGKEGGWTWALRDIDLTSEPGGSIALIGANGSGKSTLLKILTRVMYPYAGRLEIEGRVGALIEVRSGIHPQLTGRENTNLYGSLLGLNRREVATRFDEIVAFAELEHAIDRQVKFYSTGMQMRLGFAVAAFLEPDLLFVDEVLAVGDAGFQQKCLDRMGSVLASGTTLIFVSHDLSAVQATCERGVWMNQGRIMMDGEITEVLAGYRRSIEEAAETIASARGGVRVAKAEISRPGATMPRTHEPMEIALVILGHKSRPAFLHLGVTEGTAAPIFSIGREIDLGEGEVEVRCSVANLPLPRGRYYLWVGLTGSRPRSEELMAWHPVAHFDVIGPDLDPTPRAVARPSPVHVQADWEIDRRH